jgi:hypothetical protein
MHSQVVLSLFPVEVGSISSQRRERERERERKERDFREREIHQGKKLESNQAV